jgi:hypothetical protein
MKANQLRIGNWVMSANYKKIKREIKDYSVEVIRAGDIHHLETFPNSKSIKPIPLTEEWLLKFGFKKDTKYDWELKVNGVLFYGMCDDTQPVNTGIGILNLPDSIINIQHVHQLQNLYFALTGEELTINEQ